jgi:hypothetical protein
MLNGDTASKDIDSNGDPGYTGESLKMLETAEGQINAVFACFGTAAQRAQNFENGLAKFLLVFNQIAERSLRLEDLNSVKGDLHKRTMGQLMKQLSKHVTFADDTYQRYFEKALQNRNFLMHQFFLNGDAKLRTEVGRFELLAELVQMEQIFERARIAMNAMRIALCEKLGLDPGRNA